MRVAAPLLLIADLTCVALAAAKTGAIPASAHAGPSVAQSVARVEAFYKNVVTFKSAFQQKFWIKADHQERTSHGHVIFAKPGKMAWVYDDPKDNRVVSDGTLIEIYEASNRQMYVQPIDKSQYPAALSFLTRAGNLDSTFTFELFRGGQMNFPNGDVLVGTPKRTMLAYTKVVFYMDATTSQVGRVIVVDGQGNRNRLDFVDPKLNEPAASAEFEFSPSPGTSVVRHRQQHATSSILGRDLDLREGRRGRPCCGQCALRSCAPGRFEPT